MEPPSKRIIDGDISPSALRCELLLLPEVVRNGYFLVRRCSFVVAPPVEICHLNRSNLLSNLDFPNSISYLAHQLGFVGVAILKLFSVACSSNTRMPPSVVMNTAPGVNGPDAFSLELDQVFGGGGNEIDERSFIGYISSAGVHESGDVYVIDYQSNDIVAFNSDGTIKWRKGESGEGPGEINMPSTLIVLSDGLMLVNQGGGRIDRYDLNGEYQSVFRSSEKFSLKCMLPDGRFVGDEAVRGDWRLKVLTTDIENEMDSLSVLIDATFDIDEPAEFGAAMAITAYSSLSHSLWRDRISPNQ